MLPHVQFISIPQYTKLASMKKLILGLLCVALAYSTTLVEMLGMGNLL